MAARDVVIPLGLGRSVMHLLMQADAEKAFGKCADTMVDGGCVVCTTLEQFSQAVDGEPVNWPYD